MSDIEIAANTPVLDLIAEKKQLTDQLAESVRDHARLSVENDDLRAQLTEAHELIKALGECVAGWANEYQKTKPAQMYQQSVQAIGRAKALLKIQ